MANRTTNPSTPTHRGGALRIAATSVALALAMLPASGAQASPAHSAPTQSPRSAACAGGAIRSFPVPLEDAFGITAGPGGTWFSETSSIDRIRNGKVDVFPVPNPDTARVGWLTWSGSGPLWFADRDNGRLGTMTGDGAVHEYQIPDGPDGAAVPQSIVIAPRHLVWFTDQDNDRIGSLNTVTGSFSFATVPTPDAFPVGMVRGHDGDLYFVERSVDKIGRLDPNTGLFTEWTLTAGAFPNRLAVDERGNVWFTELDTNVLGRIGTDGHLSQLPLPGGPVGLTFSHGRLYAALFVSGQIAQISTTGRIERVWTMPMPSTAAPLQVAVSHGFIWSTGANDVFRVNPSCPDRDS